VERIACCDAGCEHSRDRGRAAALRLMLGVGFANYDTLYS